MFLRPCERSANMAQAHEFHGVLDAAGAFLANPSDGIFKLLAITINARYDARSHRSMVITAGIDNAAHEAAYEFLTAMNTIWDGGVPDTNYCRGALLEQIAFGLMRQRPGPPDVLVEQSVGPFPGHLWTAGVSDPIDLVVPETPEFYECKVGVTHIDGKDLQQFKLIKELDADSVTAFVTLAKAATLRDWLESLFDTPPHIYAFTYEDFLALSEGPATTKVA